MDTLVFLFRLPDTLLSLYHNEGSPASSLFPFLPSLLSSHAPIVLGLGWDWLLWELVACSGNLLSRILLYIPMSLTGSVRYPCLPPPFRLLRLVSFFPWRLFCFLGAVLRTKLLVASEFYALSSKGVGVFIQLRITAQPRPGAVIFLCDSSVACFLWEIRDDCCCHDTLLLQARLQTLVALSYASFPPSISLPPMMTWWVLPHRSLFPRLV